MRRVFVRFLEEIEDTKKTFRNYLTFRYPRSNFFVRFLEELSKPKSPFKSIETSVSFDLVDAKVNADFNPIFSQVGFWFSFRKNR